MTLILGATGHVGKPLAEMLLSSGKRVRVVSRSFDRLKPLMAKGAEPFAGDIMDSEFLTRAMTGCKGIFSLIPPNPAAVDLRDHQNAVSRSMIKSLKESGIKYVVNLSSVGAHLKGKTGPIAGLHDHEVRLDKIRGLNVVHLRAGFFMENLLMNISLIKNEGVNGSALRNDVAMPVISTRDIAVVAAKYLKDRNFKGRNIHELLGQRDITMEEITRIIGRTIGRENLQYVQFAYEVAEKGMIAAGLSGSVARAYIEMSKGFNEGIIQSGLVRTPERTTSTSFEDFMEEFRSAYCVDNVECQAVGL